MPRKTRKIRVYQRTSRRVCGHCYVQGTDESQSRLLGQRGSGIFFATIKKELLYEQVWSTHEVRIAITDYIEAFYNRQRPHSYLDYLSPADYEKKYEQLSKKVA